MTLDWNVKLAPENLSRGELLQSLKNLAKHLASLEQDEVNLEDLTAIATDVTSHGLLSHKEKGIRILVASCVADLLRLYAPNPPFTPKKLRTIFEFLLKQLELVRDLAGSFYAQVLYVLETLSQVKSILILWDLDADELVHKFFDLAFAIVTPAHPKNVTLYLSDMLRPLIDESTSLPTNTVQLMMQKLGSKARNQNPASHQLAVLVATQSVDKLQRYACQYFSDIIVSASKAVTEDAGEQDSDSNDSDCEGLDNAPKSRDESGMPEAAKAAHKLIVDIHRTVPGLLLNVIPQLEEELKVNFVGLRQLATSALGNMFTQPGSQLFQAYPNIWNSWLNRRNDKALEIRLLWVEHAVKALTTQPLVQEEVEQALALKLLDPDEHVRAQVIRCLDSLDLTDTSHVSASFLEKVGERCRDRKLLVRSQALQFMGKLFNGNVGLLRDSENLVAKERYAWIPNCILLSIQFDDVQTRALVEKTIFTHLLQSTLNSHGRAERLHLVYSLLTVDTARTCLKTVFSRQLTAISEFQQLVQLCGSVESSEERSILDKLIHFIAQKYPEPRRCESALSKLVQSGEKIILRLFTKLWDPSNENETLLRVGRDLLRRCEAYFHSSDALSALIRRLTVCFLNQDTVNAVVDAVDTLEKSQCLLLYNELTPQLYAGRGQKLYELGCHYPNAWSGLAQLVHHLPECGAIVDDERVQLIKSFSSTSGYGAIVGRLLSVIPDKRGHQVAAELADELLDTLSTETVEKLRGLCEIARYNLLALEEAGSDRLTRLLLSEILLSPAFLSGDAQVAKEAVVLVVQIFVARLVSLSKLSDQVELMDSMSNAVLKLVFSLLEYDGDLFQSPMGQRYLPNADFALEGDMAAQLRLAAGLGALDLAASLPQRLLTTHQEALGCLLQDPVVSVRFHFLERLCVMLLSQTLPLSFCSLLVLTAHEPLPDMLLKARTCFHQIVTSTSNQAFLMGSQPTSASADQGLSTIFFHVVHLLAVHPDFDTEFDDLKAFAMYLEYMLEALLSAENASFVYYLSTLLKTVRCVETDSTNLYLLSEMLQLLIQQRCKVSGWSLPTFPGKAELPAKLFVKLSQSQERIVVKTFYLSREIVDYIKTTPPSHLVSVEGTSKGKRNKAHSDKAAPKKVKR